jgi:heat shock protein HslJ
MRRTSRGLDDGEATMIAIPTMLRQTRASSARDLHVIRSLLSLLSSARPRCIMRTVAAADEEVDMLTGIRRFVFAPPIIAALLAVSCAKQPVAQFAANAPTDIGPQAAKVADLAGPDWKLESFDPNSPVAPEIHITLSVVDQKLSGQSGCNHYAGTIRDGDEPGELRLGPLALTRMSCNREADAAEKRYMMALQNAKAFRLEHGKLLVTYQDHESTRTLTYSRA